MSDVPITSSLARVHADGAQPFLDAYAVAFPGNVKHPETWEPMQRAIREEYRMLAEFRAGLGIWREACRILAARHIGDWPSLRREFYRIELENAETARRDAEQKALPPRSETASAYGRKLSEILRRFVAGDLDRAGFLAAIYDEAHASGAFECAAAVYLSASNAFDSLPPRKRTDRIPVASAIGAA